MGAKINLTVSDKLLLAAYDLDKGERRSFTAEDLVVAAWRRFPRAFGLRGHHDEKGVPRYPDSNRVFAEIMGSKPIRKRGYLVKIGQKTYGLTVSGRHAAAKLDETTEMCPTNEPVRVGGKATMSRETLARLERLLGSRAVERVRQGDVERLTFHDACMFWGITPRSTSIELEGSLANVESVIREAVEAIRSGASELRTGRNDLSQSTTDLLHSVHGHLQQKFSQDLATIRGRTDQRKA